MFFRRIGFYVLFFGFVLYFFYFSKQVCQYLYCGLIMLPAMSNELNIRTENLPSHVMAG